MNQQSTGMVNEKARNTALMAVIVIAIGVAGIWWFGFARDLPVQPTPEQQAELSSLQDYIDVRFDHTNSDYLYSPEQEGFNQIAEFPMECPGIPDGPCGLPISIVTAEPVKEGKQEFYLVEAGGALYTYFGPFMGDLGGLITDAVELGGSAAL